MAHPLSAEPALRLGLVERSATRPDRRISTEVDVVEAAAEREAVCLWQGGGAAALSCQPRRPAVHTVYGVGFISFRFFVLRNTTQVYARPNLKSRHFETTARVLSWGPRVSVQEARQLEDSGLLTPAILVAVRLGAGVNGATYLLIAVRRIIPNGPNGPNG